MMENKETDIKPCDIHRVVCSASNKKPINHKNSKYCTYQGECYQTLACQARQKKLCTHFDSSVK